MGKKDMAKTGEDGQKITSGSRIGVVGAGTMGSGIALAALYADLHVTLYDVSQEMIDKAKEYIEYHLNRKRKAINIKYLRLTKQLEDLRGSQVAIEAIPEDLSLKQELFSRLDQICPPPAILATNTSTLPVTSIAAQVHRPERVAGMHFFNPAPVLPLVEIVRGARTAPETIKTLVSLGEKMGKTPVVTKDTPGFIVNRVARPFYGEALRLLGERIANCEQIDTLVEKSGGFRMGPFRLMDLIGIDVNFSATRSIYEQTFFEPRYRPHLIQAQMVGQKALGRKTGRGFYRYDLEETEEKGNSYTAGSQGRWLVYLSPGSWAPGIRDLCEDAGFAIIETEANSDQDGSEEAKIGIVAAGRSEGTREHVQKMDQELPAGVPILCQCADVMTEEAATWLRHPERLAGFDGLFLANGEVATLVAGPNIKPETQALINSFFSDLGIISIWIKDSPGLILPRIVSGLVNEAAFAAGEGVAEPVMIDTAMRLGTNYPYGPIEWGQKIGYKRIIRVLEHLQAEYGEERYRVAPLLRSWGRREA
jgi:3-hydroxybutyryl-CoA dehydrogenase